ncbi:EmrB/QacA subfamily drug resistance transporter [Sediminihabitans luteus]|uniref:EmrB/QacA subfamily drug resistance transporter n=1 Tax=Sediminihabitans luteus TaxID=1138585 RepID=A0A2M9CEQ4_9CELL|nr:MFS transporter [Sediminihabitans luteus]PJJ70411.1 EmrB/QacA subfamily drug resistance transporter [Sediminihabitans luteus]GII97884.1 MFS transporter [Sediminihabitans luteus]
MFSAPSTSSPDAADRTSAGQPSASARGTTAVLAIILVGYFMVILDNSIVITGLPHIQAELGMSSGALAWVQDAYLLTFGGLLLLGARAGDVLGRRRTFVLGLAVFTLASVAVGLAPTGAWLVGARAVQGVGAAVLAPSTLALLTATFPEGAGRSRATAAYGAVAGIGASVGLVVGGLLADLVSWRAGFLVNLPIGVVMLVAGLRALPETERRPGRVDVAGSLLATAGPAALVYGFVRAGEVGWSDAVTVVALVSGVALLAWLVLVERTAAQPVLPLRLFTSRERVGAYLARLLFIGAMMGFFLFTSQYLQDARGFTALAAGIAFFPMTIVNFAVALAVPRLQRRSSGPALLVVGLALAVVGMGWLSTIDPSTSYAVGVALPMTLVGAGQGLAFGPLTASGVVGVDAADAGAASGAVNAFHQLGGALGTSLVLAVAATYAGAMFAGTVLLVAALVAAVVLVLPTTRR